MKDVWLGFQHWCKNWIRVFALWLLSLVDDGEVIAPLYGVGVEGIGDKFCERCKCFLPLNCLRNHDGKYRCSSCKVKANG